MAITSRDVSAWDNLYASPDGTPQRRYALFQRHAQRRTVQRLNHCLSLLEPKPGMKVLDLGAGTGAYCTEIVSRGASWIGVDLSIDMLKAARRRHAPAGSTPATWINGVAQALPFGSDSFDGAICIGMLNFLPTRMWPGVLSELRRVVRRGGVVVLTSLRLDILTWLRSRLYGVAPLPLSSPGPLYPQGPGPLRLMLTEAGFECEQVLHVKKYLGLPHYTMMKIRKR